MGERKVLNKYYPPDFDPALIPKATRPKNNQVKVRMMLPMSVRCQICGEYLYRGKKFNARKETVDNEDYLGIKVFRFYLKCTRCAAEFTIKTDPRNSDYACEQGASRNFEPWREKDNQIDAIKAKREQEEQGDAMKALENRTADSRLEMDILEALEDVKSINARNSKVDIDSLLERKRQLDETARKQQEDMLRLSEADEELVQRLFHSRNSSIIKRLADAIEEEILEDDEDDEEEFVATTTQTPTITPATSSAHTTTTPVPPPTPKPKPAVTPSVTTTKKRPLSMLMPGLVTVTKKKDTPTTPSTLPGPSDAKRPKTEHPVAVNPVGSSSSSTPQQDEDSFGGLVSYD
eukprot:TRINITY_DN1580_c0_g2_i1.p1 TRINITY_DN1580_c0_g2~~TRINITY_DN1580_c0_g2_i1.p1  ORF type:complete len:348 (-),score=112.50 TRINITY_DN1580_c0_g2_i1:46-1089(-)